VRRAAARSPGRRRDPAVTEALLGCLTSQDRHVRRAAARSPGRRQDPAVTEALLSCLADEDVRGTVGWVLGKCESPEILLILARMVRSFSQPSIQAAEPFMIRLYRRIDLDDQPEVLDAMGWLTTAALSDRSA